MALISSTPVIEPIIPKEFDFPTAIEMIADGLKVTKVEWGDQEIYGLLKDGVLQLRKKDGKFYQWILSEGDLAGQDYIAVQ